MSLVSIYNAFGLIDLKISLPI